MEKKYLTEVCCHPTTFETIEWKPSPVILEEVEKYDYHITVLKDFKVYFGNVKDGIIHTGELDLALDEVDGWLPDYQSTRKTVLLDSDIKPRIWIHEFYQEDTEHYTGDWFYISQRNAVAVLMEEKKLKNGLFLAKVVSIEPKGEFRIMGVAGGCKHQYKVGDTFKLRCHKRTDCKYLRNYWFDVRYPSQEFAESFRLMNNIVNN